MGSLRTDRLWMEVQHQAGLRHAGMQACGQFLAGYPGLQAIDPTPQKAGKNGETWAKKSELSGCHLQKRNLSPVGVEQHKTAKALIGDLGAQACDGFDQDIGRKAEGTWEVQVLRGKTHGLNG